MNKYSNSHIVHWTHEGVVREVNILLGETAEIEYVRERKTQNTDEPSPIKIENKKPKKKEKKKKKGCTTCGAKGIKRLLLGSAKLLKSELGIDASDEKTMSSRRGMCESCEHYDFGVCGECGCFCAAKVKLKSELCPIGKW